MIRSSTVVCKPISNCFRSFSSLPKYPVIDIHSHFLPHSWPDYSKKFGDAQGPWPWMRHGQEKDNKKAMLMLGDQEFRPVDSRCWEMSLRLEDMDRDGVDHQIISNTPLLFQYHRPIHQTIEVAQKYNDLAIEMAARGNGRLSALAQVPLQDIAAACQEASRAMSIGHKGIQIGNHVGDIDLDDERLIAFFQYCAEENIPILVHPWDMLGGDRLKKWMMAWTVGMPCETQLSIVALILSGAFDKIPKSLKLCFAHGGGSFAFLLPRLDNAWTYRRDAVGKNCDKLPSSYCDRFSVDSAVFGVDALAYLVSVMGEDRVMLGSDYPYPLGEQRVGNLIKDAQKQNKISETTANKLLSTNAQKFFNIKS